MEPHIINVLLTSFAGLNLPPTLCLPLPASTTITQLQDHIHSRLPAKHNSRLILTTISNRQIPDLSSKTISNFLPNHESDFLSLRLGLQICGGKGGFGSQLRAAGGRMSSKPKRSQGDENASSRNLDGRRLRTVNEAKALAEYLTIKPDMAKREQEQRRKRWEQVVELAERREDEMKNGSKAKIDGKWVEDKEEACERTRDAVISALKTGLFTDNLTEVSPLSMSSSDEDSYSGASCKGSPSSSLKPQIIKAKKFHGFDEDDEFMSSDEDSDK